MSKHSFGLPVTLTSLDFGRYQALTGMRTDAKGAPSVDPFDALNTAISEACAAYKHKLQKHQHDSVPLPKETAALVAGIDQGTKNTLANRLRSALATAKLCTPPGASPAMPCLLTSMKRREIQTDPPIGNPLWAYYAELVKNPSLMGLPAGDGMQQFNQLGRDLEDEATTT